MSSYLFVASLVTCGLVVVLCSTASYGHAPTHTNELAAGNDSSGYLVSQLHVHYAQLQQHGNVQQTENNPNFTHFATSKKNSTSSETMSPHKSTKPLSVGSSAPSNKQSLQPAHVYKADVPTHIELETHKAVNAAKLASGASVSDRLHSSNSKTNLENNEEISKKIIGSSVVTSVSVILNGDELEFTDALGQKVPKPLPSLQVASPIDLLNPDRYEFYAFDDKGELIKRLMTIEEIQSIVANGDGDGPTIIHHGPIADRDPEKSVRDIVNSVQNVLNKEVESNKNTSMDSMPTFDTPNVSSSWSMILPAVFGNTGNVDIFPQKKLQQVVMTPDSEIIETSTKELVSTTAKKPKPNRKKTNLKRRTTTTEMAPQIIQEELDSQESVYTGMQQYQNLAATMHNYDGFSQLHLQPIYHKLPQIETSTRRVLVGNEEMVKKPATFIKNEQVSLNENFAKKPVFMQYKPLPPHRVKKPNGSHIISKQPLTDKQKVKRKPPTTSAPTEISKSSPIFASTTVSRIPVPVLLAASNKSKLTATTTTTTATAFQSTKILTDKANITSTLVPTLPAKTETSITQPSKKKKTKPTQYPMLSTSTIMDGSTRNNYLSPQKRKPSTKPHKLTPRPTQHTLHSHITSTFDLAAEGTAHQEVSHNKFQHASYHKTRPRPSKPVRPTGQSTDSNATTEIPTTVIFSPVPTTTSNNTIEDSLIVQNFPGFQQAVKNNESPSLMIKTTTQYPEPTTSYGISSTSGTSGYPVPSYDTSTDESEDPAFDLYKPLPLLALTQHSSKPNEEDAHTLLSFDQIMQTLKQPEQLTENQSELKETPDEKAVPLNDNVLLRPLSTMKSPFDHNTGYPFSATVTAPEDSIYLSSSEKQANSLVTKIPQINITNDSTQTDFPNLTSFTDTSVEKAEYFTIKQSDEANKPQTHNSISKISDQTTPTWEDNITTDANQMFKDYTDHPLIQSRLPVSSPDTRNNVSQPILIVDLKPQLNMEVVKPSAETTMSNFQTQAATIASTLIDVFNTVPTDYSLVRSNNSKDEIPFLMSDVINQISDASNKSESHQSTFNHNRFSNQAHLNLTFFMSPDKEHKEAPKTSSIAPNKLNYQQTFETITKHDHKKQVVKQTNESLHTEAATISLNPITLKETTNVPSDMQKIEKPTLTSHTTQRNSFKNRRTTPFSTRTTPNALDKQSLTMPQRNHDHLVSISDEHHKESSNEKICKEEKTLRDSSTTEDEQGDTTLPPPTTEFEEKILIQQHDKPWNKVETDSLSDTTTLILPEERITLLTEEDEISLKGQETQDAGDMELSQNPTETEGIIENLISDILSEVTTPAKEYLDQDMQVTTVTPTKIGNEKFNANKIESSTYKTETAENIDDLNGTSVPVQTDTIETRTNNNNYASPSEKNETQLLQDEKSKLGIEEYGPVTKNRIEEHLTPQLITTSEMEEENTTFKTEANKETEETTTITYQISEETSAELNAMISEEDETDESADEDPYIKLGEATTPNPGLSLANQKFVTKKTNPETNTLVLSKSNHSTVAKVVPTEAQTTTLLGNFDGISAEADEEDEQDQMDYHVTKFPSSLFSTAVVTRTTTTTKPKTTTWRLNTLKPVSYFNKHPAYGLYKEPVEPLYNKHPKPLAYIHQKGNTQSKGATYSMATPQQRPMQRPPQLSNLMISSTQATRPPIILEPAPNNSKGLEASISNLDEDILTFSQLCNELAFSYWKSITSEKISSARSLVISPFALTSMLSMVFLGARGSTSGEMNDVLKLDDMVAFNPHLVFKNITDSVEKSTDSDIATTAFVREIYSDRANGKVLQFFKEKTQQLYSGHVEEVNFHVVNDIIRRRTNLLIKRHTMGKVLEYLRTNSVWVNGPLATISANLYQTDCSYGSTQDRDGEIFFQVHPTVRQRRLVPIPAVLFKSGFTAGYEPNLDATIVAFGHIQDITSVIFVMPGHLSSISPSDNLDRLEKQLLKTAFSKNAWSNILISLSDRPGMEVQIPRFSHRSFVNATSGLQKMGLKSLFKSDYADLAGLTGSSNRDVYLSDMIQINTFSTCGEEKIADHHHVEMYPAPPLRKRNKDVDAHDDDSLESIIDFGSLVQDTVLGRGFYDDLLDPKYLELPLPLRPRQARVPDPPKLRFDKPFLYFVRHNPTGIILFMGRFNPRLLP